MLALCLSTSIFASSSDEEESSSCPPCQQADEQRSAPIPIGAHREENGMQRSGTSSLSSSAESLCSVRSSYSTRSAAAREAERRENRRLLDLSINKIQGPNQPLRRHLLVYNTVKAIQRELDCLDEEEMYVSLMEPSFETPVEDQWLFAPAEQRAQEEEQMEVMRLAEEKWTWHSDAVEQPTVQQEGCTGSDSWSWMRTVGNNTVTTECWESAYESSRDDDNVSEDSGHSSSSSHLFLELSSPASPYATCAATNSLLYQPVSDWQEELACWERGFDTSLGDCSTLSARDLFHLLPMQA